MSGTLGETSLVPIRTKASESWNKPLNLIAFLIVASIVATVIIWWLYHVDFATGGMLGGMGWPSFQGGMLVFGLIALLMIGASSTIAMSFSSYERALMVGIAVIIALLTTLGFMLKFARDGSPASFVLFASVSLISAAVVTLYGFRSVYLENLGRKLLDEVQSQRVRARYTICKWASVGTAIGFVGLLFASIAIYRHLASE